MAEKRTSKVGEKVDRLKDTVRAKINDMARDAAKNLQFGVSIINIQAKEIQSEVDSDRCNAQLDGSNTIRFPWQFSRSPSP
jgi:hypothetical protein